MTVTIYHNSACGTSRNTLAMIRQSGEEPTIIDYLTAPPSRDRLVSLIKSMDIPVRALLREKEALFSTLGLADPAIGDDQIIDAMIAHPILMNRPIVETSKARGFAALPNRSSNCLKILSSRLSKRTARL